VTHTPSADASSPDEAETAAQAARHGELGDIRAERVEIVQGGANSIDAHTVTIRQGGAAMVSATDVSVSQGGIFLARAERVTLRENSSALAVAAEQASLSGGSNVGLLLARDISQIGGGSNVGLLLARNVSGEVRALLDWRAAAAFGAAFALVVSILRRR
jgi:hypothetical protein